MTEHAASMIPLIIPAYEPDERLLSLIKKLAGTYDGPMIVVDDGSGEGYKDIFDKTQELIKDHGGYLLAHDRNRGKGRALKTAFEYVIKQYPQAVGCVTADSDGQHTPACIGRVASELRSNPSAFVLGVRDFKGEKQRQIPWKSRFGNNLTENVFAYVAGVRIHDTQTGLRGIPTAFMRQLLEVRGERFEFETRMLLEGVGQYQIVEVPIETVYDSVENHQTHFHPVMDSIKIYRILGERFVKYILSSVSSSVIDVALFLLFSHLFEKRFIWNVAVATVFARVISASYNYFMNRKVVFRSKKGVGSSGKEYLALALIQMGMSAALVTGGTMLFPVPKAAVKIGVDSALFLASYYVQQRYVFGKDL